MIVTLVCVDRGIVSATARGCLKPKAKLRYAAEPFNFGEYVLSGANGKYIVTECCQIESFSAITSDIEKYYAGFSALGALEQLSREPNPQAFTHTLKTLGELAYGTDKTAARIMTEFMLDILECNGLPLDFAHCNVCKCDLDDIAYFSDKDGIVCKHCRDIFNDIAIEGAVRTYIDGADAPHEIESRANILLANLVYRMLGVKINTRFCTE